MAAAINVERKGKLRIGWTVAKVEMLAKRPLQCYCCWEYGHIRFQCRANVDRNGLCFNCGNQGHSVKECRSDRPRCIICEKRGHQANHRIGSRFCSVDKFPERKRQPFRGKTNEENVERKTAREERKEGECEEEKMEYNEL